MFLVGCQNKPEVVGEMENADCKKDKPSLSGDTVIYNESTIDGGIGPSMIEDSTVEGKMKVVEPKTECKLKGEVNVVDEPMVDGDMVIEE
jgi:hypothetical protein